MCAEKRPLDVHSRTYVAFIAALYRFGGPAMDVFEKLAARKARRDAERAQIEAARSEQNRRLAALNTEADRDEIALQVYRELSREDGADPVPEQITRAIHVVGTPPVKDMVLAILKTSPNPLTAKQIKGMATIRFRTAINPNTLTVTLGRYKSDGTVRLEGRAWRYVPEGERAGGNATEHSDLLESRH